MDEITDDSNNVDSLPKKRRIYTLFLLLGVVGGLVLFVAIALWYFKRVDVPPPKMPQPTGVLSFAGDVRCRHGGTRGKNPRVFRLEWPWSMGGNRRQDNGAV